nr:hypothetical protein [Salmonella enterica subsp. enterica serovar Rissen]
MTDNKTHSELDKLKEAALAQRKKLSTKRIHKAADAFRYCSMA